MVNPMNDDEVLELIKSEAPDLFGKVIYVLRYGSSVRTSRPTRDNDVLLVSESADNRYSRPEKSGDAVHLHCVSQNVISADLDRDRYGWLFVTKYLGDFRVVHGSQASAMRDKARAFIRILEHWVALSGINVFTAEQAFSGIVETLTGWNPQFGLYVGNGKINLLEYEYYVKQKLFGTDEALARLERDVSGFRFKDGRANPECDLRVALIRYWCYYMYYKDSQDKGYLTEKVDDTLRRKGLIL
jgi:hypothetical protein